MYGMLVAIVLVPLCTAAHVVNWFPWLKYRNYAMTGNRDIIENGFSSTGLNPKLYIPVVQKYDQSHSLCLDFYSGQTATKRK